MSVTISHRLPGRVRMEISGIRKQPIVAFKLQAMLGSLGGIDKAVCNASTGRVLIHFDERMISLEKILATIKWFICGKPENVQAEVAAASETDILQAVPPKLQLVQGARPELANRKNIKRTDNPYFLPAVAAGGLLGMLTLKRVLVGKSALAAAPIPFYVAAGLSIVAGYPALRRGVEGIIRERRLHPDLMIGLTTLSLAALRENLIALSAITLLNIALYQRHTVIDPLEATHLDPAVARHSQRMSRLGLLLAPISLLLTRSPLRALGVLLASNPRPILQAHKYRWARVEQEASEKQLPLPQRGNLETLAAARTIVFTNGSMLNQDGQEWRYRFLRDGMDESKAAAIAASLLQKQEHPWREPLLQFAQEQQRTLRTPFDVECTDDGVIGTLNGHQTIFGTKAFLKQLEIDLTPALFEERRLRREGFKPYILAQDGELLAVVGRRQELSGNWPNRIRSWEEQGYTVRCLQVEERIPCQVEPITVQHLSHELAEGTPVLLVGSHDMSWESPHLVEVHNDADLDKLLPFCAHIKADVHNDLRLTKIWNTVGPALAFFTPITAPLVNLLTDTVGLFLLAKQDWRERFRTGSFEREKLSPTEQKVKPLLAQSRNQYTFHAMEHHEVLQAVNARLKGLTQVEVLQRRRKFGINALQAPPGSSPLRTFLGQFKEFSTVILLGAAGLSLFMGETFNALCMGGILVVNALIGTWQEVRSASILQTLKSEDNSRTKVLRDGNEHSIPAIELVPGDIVLLEAGDMVPADLRILEAINVEVNEAMLTGESLPVAKHAKTLPEATPMADRSNLLYMGTILTRGRVSGLVVSTGSRTEIGALQSLLEQGDEPPTPLQNRVSEIGKRFVMGALIAGVVVGAAGLIRGIPPAQLLVSTITLAASAIPEGLPLTITIALTAGVMRMSKRKAAVRKLASLESLGRVTVICSDKTGTLTRNEMTVKEIATVGQRIRVTGDGYMPEGAFYASDDEEVLLSSLTSDVRQLLTIGLLCNNASLEKKGPDYKRSGDPTEIALLAAGMKACINTGEWIRHREIPFDSYTNSMSVVCQENEHTENCLILTKGSPESVVQKCTHYLISGKAEPLTDPIRRQIEEENLRMAGKTLRVLGFAYRPLDSGDNPQDAKEEGLIFVGLMGMIDPPKEDVAASIEAARSLGVKPVMITGDHPVTARAIATQLGIYRSGDVIITGQEVEKLSSEELSRLVPAASVFARVSPEHKLRIVEAYQQNGEVVAMTGDGVNDAPAVRKADVGIAMGAQGTDITKDTAGIVLMEDHFHSIVDGIKEGRTIIANIRKAIGCLLTGNLAEVLVTAAAVIVGLPLPLIPLQILLMNLLTDAIPAMVLATNSERTDVEKRHQDVVDNSLYRTVITRGTILGLGALGVFAGALAGGIALPVAQTMAFATLVAGQLIQTVSWRRLETVNPVPFNKDRSLLLAMGISWSALIAAIYLPGMQGLFATVPLALPHWAAILTVSSSVTALSGVILKRPMQAVQLAATPVAA